MDHRWLFWRDVWTTVSEKAGGARTEIAQLKSQLIAAKMHPQGIVKEKDNLRNQGYRRGLCKAFNDADVHTFSEPAALTVERAREIIKLKDGRPMT